MAAFTSSIQHQFLIDSFLNSNTSFSQFCHPLQMETNLDLHSVSAVSNNDPSPVFSMPAANMTSMDSSSIITADYNVSTNNSSEQVSAQKVTKPMKVNNIKKRNSIHGASSAQSKDMREVKEKKQKKVMNKDDEEQSKSNEGKKKKKRGEKKANEDEPPIGYIHVRARRGQATDSHSLAERVRRERISERMRLLQSLVPGCDKVTGKALMLDEIINYVQSLQHQVEFLSSKLASLNPMSYDFGMDLESFMFTPNQNLNSLTSPQQCSPTEVNNNLLLDNISANAVLLQHVQLPNTLPQGNRQMLWEVDEQRQKFINQSGFSNTNLFSFH